MEIIMEIMQSYDDFEKLEIKGFFHGTMIDLLGATIRFSHS